MTDTGAQIETLTSEEIASQPAMWARALTDPSLEVQRLPAAGEHVLVVGCGTSYYIGDAWAHLRMAAGLGRTRAAVASELAWVEPDETVLVLSRSGTTSDVERLARRLGQEHRVIGIVGTAATPIAQACHDAILLDFADERSVVQTRFATTVLALLRRAIDDRTDDLVAQAEQALSSELPLAQHDHVVFLGAGWSVGLAHEAALKCREAAGAWTEAYPVREYQHGPIAAAGERTLVWSLAPPGDELREAIAATGATLYEATLDPMAELVRAQRAAVELARRAGRNPDHPAHLSRSVIDD